MFVLIFFRNQTGSRVIHPDNVQRVFEARQRLGVDSETVSDRQQEQQHQQQQQDQHQHDEQNGNAQTPPIRRRYNFDPTCPVCLAELAYATETNCGHVFCGMFFA